MATDDRSNPHRDRRTDHELGEAAVALTAELVAIDSVNPGLVPGAAGEAAVVEHLRKRLLDNGFDTHVITPRDRHDRPSLVAVSPRTTTAAGRSGPAVVLTGHVDTVGVEGMAEPFAARVDGDRLAGRGASDMKGGVAAMVVAAEELVRRGATGCVVLALVADEEDASRGTEAVLDSLPSLELRPDVAVVGEPTWLAMTETLRGFAVVEVTLSGRAAHSSQPELGVSAVAHLGRLLAAVEGRNRALADVGGSLLVTVASGGDSPFVIPRTARAVVERRTVPGESSAAALAEVEQLLTSLQADDPAVDGSARLLAAREPWRLDETGPAATLAAAIEEALGEQRSAERFHAPYWMEAPLWQAAGIPALVCGPAGGGLHAADEWVDLRQVRRYAVALTTAVERWVAENAD